MKRTILSLILVLVLSAGLVLSAAAAEQLVYDEADLLTASEEAALERQLRDISQAYEAQVVVCTVSHGEGSVDAYVDFVYDSMGFGYGPNRDGVLLLVCMSQREYRILSNGYAGAAITAGDIELIGDAMVSDLSAGNYADAFRTFGEECAYYLDGYLNGYPFPAGSCLLVSVGIGVVAALIVLLVMRSQLKSVRRQNRAGNYVRPGSMNLRVRQDIYLYRTVSRRRRETGNSSSRPSGAGRSRGGGSF